jgi:hypothetical protein
MHNNYETKGVYEALPTPKAFQFEHWLWVASPWVNVMGPSLISVLTPLEVSMSCLMVYLLLVVVTYVMYFMLLLWWLIHVIGYHSTLKSALLFPCVCFVNKPTSITNVR